MKKREYLEIEARGFSDFLIIAWLLKVLIIFILCGERYQGGDVTAACDLFSIIFILVL